MYSSNVYATVERQKKIVIGTMTVHVENRNCSSVWFPAQFSYRVYWTPFLDHNQGQGQKLWQAAAALFWEKKYTSSTSTASFEFFMSCSQHSQRCISKKKFPKTFDYKFFIWRPWRTQIHQEKNKSSSPFWDSSFM